MTTNNPTAHLHDRDAELGVLGGILLRPELLSTLRLEVDDFFVPQHGHVFSAMRNLEADGRAIDHVTIGDELGRMGDLRGKPLREVCEPVIADALLRTPIQENVEEYAAIVRRHRVTRDTVRRLGDVIALARSGELSGHEVVGAATSALAGIGGDEPDPGKPLGRLVRDECADAERDIARRERGEGVYVGAPTGLSKLDAKLGGLPYGLLTVVAGRPGTGKTTLLQTIARNYARLTGDAPVIYTAEDRVQSFAQREMAAESGVPTEAIRARTFSREEMQRLAARMPVLLKAKPIVVECHGWTVEDIARDVRRRRLKAKQQGRSEAGLVLVDYLHRLKRPPGSDRQDEKLRAMTDVLVTLAGAEGIATVLGSQLSRDIERRDDKTPRMSDIREAGAVEELCKTMLGLYVDPDRPQTLEIHVLKNHNGEANVIVEVHWHRPTHRLVDAQVDLAGR